MHNADSGARIARLVGFMVISTAIPDGSALAAEPPANEALEEITVTARRTEESVLDVPLAVTAISAAAIEDRGIRDITDIATYTPSFRFQNQSVGRNDRGFKQYVIRGMVPNSALATRQAASLFVDGAPAAGGNVSGVTDVERVEIIKGPQSAFFGRSTFAGAINFVTRAPSYDFQGRVVADVSSFDTHDLSATIEGPIVADKLALRLNGRAYETDGNYGNAAQPGARLGARETQSGSLAALWEPTEALRVRAFYSLWNDSDATLPANARFGLAQHNCNAGAAPAGQNNYICGELGDVPVSTRRWDTYVDPVALQYLQGIRGTGITLHGGNFITHTGLERDAYQARISAEQQLSAGYSLSGLVAYSRNKWGFLQTTAFIDNTLIPNPAAAGGPDRLPYNYSLVLGNTQDKDRTFELRLSSPREGAFKWSAGVNYAFARTDNLTTVFGNTGYLLATPHTINQSETRGVFAAAAYAFGGGFTVTAEGRYQKDELLQETQAGDFPQFEDSFTAFTPRLIGEWEFAPERKVYVSWSEGTRPGEFNSIFFAQTAAVRAQILAQTNVEPGVPEDNVQMGEIGLKGLFLDGRLRVLADVYKGRWTDRKIPNFIPFIAANGQQQTIQITAPAGIVDLQGIELEGAWRIATGLTLETTFSIAETEIRRTFCTDCTATTGNPTPVGTQLPYYPKTSGTFAIDYERAMGRDWTGRARVDYIYAGRIYESEANLAWTAPSSRVNLRFGVERDNLRVELYGTNVFDDDTPTSLARTAQSVFSATGVTIATPSAITVSLADRAAWGLRASYGF
jgi:iron complex outermembrane recepter protein